MLVVFPFSIGDRPQLLSLLHLLDEWSGPQPFPCLLVCEHGLETDEIKQLAGKLFLSAGLLHVRTIGISQQTPTGSWPASPNGYFQQVAEAISTSTSEPWLWHESDLMPLDRDYLKAINADYLRGGKRFYGPVCGTYRRRLEGNPAAGFVQVSEHLIGTAIYPADFFATSDLCRYVVNNAEESLRRGEHVVPFDVFLEAETTPNAHRSMLIQHGWRSRNYRRNGARIEFDVDVDYGQDKFIRAGVMLQHGCKDDSLLSIVRVMAGLDSDASVAQIPLAASGASGRLQEQGELDSRKAHNLSSAGSNPAHATLSDNEMELMAEIEELKRQRDERALYWEMREKELLAKLPAEAPALALPSDSPRVMSIFLSPGKFPKGTGKVKHGKPGKKKLKSKRTPEEQAKIRAARQSKEVGHTADSAE